MDVVIDHFYYYKQEDCSTWRIGRECFLHGVVVLQHAEKNELFLEESAFLLNQLGIYAANHISASEAEKYYERSLAIIQKLGSESEPHPLVIDCLDSLSQVCASMGDPKKSIDWHEQLLSIYTSRYGESYSKVAGVLNNLGNTWNVLGENEKAKECYEKALRSYKSLYGDNDPRTADILNNLGNIYNTLGNPKKAIEYCMKALGIYKNSEGSHQSMQVSPYVNLGDAWSALRNKEKAIECYESAVDIKKTFYGNDHLEVSYILNKLVIVCVESNNYKKAEEDCQEALRIRKKHLNNQHPKVAIIRGNLGVIQNRLGWYKEAIKNFNKVLNIPMENYEDDGFRHVASNLNNLGIAWSNLGEYQKAIDECYNPAINSYKKICGNEDPVLAGILCNIATAHRELKEYSSAEDFAKKAFNIFEAANHPFLSKSLCELGEIMYGQKKLPEARGFFQQVLECSDKFYPHRDHIDKANALMGLGKIAREESDIAKSLECLHQAQAILGRIYGEKHPDIAKCKSYLGQTLQVLGKTEDAFDCYEKACEISSEFLEKNHPSYLAYQQHLNALADS